MHIESDMHGNLLVRLIWLAQTFCVFLSALNVRSLGKFLVDGAVTGTHFIFT